MLSLEVPENRRIADRWNVCISSVIKSRVEKVNFALHCLVLNIVLHCRCLTVIKLDWYICWKTYLRNMFILFCPVFLWKQLPRLLITCRRLNSTELFLILENLRGLVHSLDECF